jgi:hypothetical protein
MRCVLSRLCREGRITLEQHATSKKWNRLSQAYRQLLSGEYDAGASRVAGLSSARIQGFERAVIRRYRALAGIMGPVDRAIIEGRGRYPRSLSELASVRRCLDEIEKRWCEVG